MKCSNRLFSHCLGTTGVYATLYSLVPDHIISNCIGGRKWFLTISNVFRLLHTSKAPTLVRGMRAANTTLSVIEPRLVLTVSSYFHKILSERIPKKTADKIW